MPVESCALGYRHDHAYLASRVPVMRADNIGKIDDIDAEIICLG